MRRRRRRKSAISSLMLTRAAARCPKVAARLASHGQLWEQLHCDPSEEPSGHPGALIREGRSWLLGCFPSRLPSCLPFGAPRSSTIGCAAGCVAGRFLIGIQSYLHTAEHGLIPWPGSRLHSLGSRLPADFWLIVSILYALDLLLHSFSPTRCSAKNIAHRTAGCIPARRC